jgi:WD40 repeat protein
MDASVNGRNEVLTYGKRKLCSRHLDGTIKVWDVSIQKPKLKIQVKGHNGPVTCLAFLQSLDRLFSASADMSIKI